MFFLLLPFVSNFSFACCRCCCSCCRCCSSRMARPPSLAWMVCSTALPPSPAILKSILPRKSRIEPPRGSETQKHARNGKRKPQIRFKKRKTDENPAREAQRMPELPIHPTVYAQIGHPPGRLLPLICG
ncbi:hypothetical protein ENH_00008100 [Eimeria necatrix]|uniref:Secreted protein n=1 Tax=Eimeria necatrix TaxID=51315 RepID=U6MDB2_9EIME|nr:hypothetical protein ENH_00008100 [Eimeria necatrix]CDJ62222.1 hypothetical protein ENH_00008100 [Eimeria necatrix]